MDTKLPFGAKSIVDCTQMVNEKSFSYGGVFGAYVCPFVRNFEGFRGSIAFDAREEGGARKDLYMTGCDVGTHIDSPSHFFTKYPNGKPARCIHQLKPSELIAKGSVIDVTKKVEENNDYLLTTQDILDFEAKYGKIKDNSIVIMKTGWGGRFEERKCYENKCSKGLMHFPGFSPKCAKFLVNERKIVGIGIDTPSLDHGPSPDFPTHKVILAADKYQVENMNLEQIPEGIGSTFICSPLKVEGAPEAMARVFAVLT